MTELKSIRQIVTKKECKDIQDWIIPEGTILHVVDDSLPRAPFGDRHKLLIVRVDNGTGDLNLMPETAVRDTEVEK